MIPGDEVLRVLRDKYERRVKVEFATLGNTRDGDILFSTGSGVNVQPEIIRVLEVPWFPAIGRIDVQSLLVATIYPECPACKERECRHPSVMPVGSLLCTEIIDEQ